MLGIELNPYAAELARVSTWIAEIQWMRRNGFEASKDPILKPLGTIECRDAVLASDGAAADWPEAEFIIGNPPFLGNKRMVGELGEDYASALRAAWPKVPGGADLVAYWVAGAWDAITAGRTRRTGLVTTNSIRGGANRTVLTGPAMAGAIFEAWSDEPWTVAGAAVRVSMVMFGEGDGAARLDGAEVERIAADLTAGLDLTTAERLKENEGACYQGVKFVGPFDIDDSLARSWLKAPTNPNGSPNSCVLKRYLTGSDISRRPSIRWVIDFGADRTRSDSSFFEAPFEHVSQHVKPLRDENRRESRRLNWWKHGELNRGMRAATEPLDRYITTPEVAKHRTFQWVDARTLITGSIYLVARDDDTTFGILHSRFHEAWALRMGTSLEDRPRYTPSTTFETFPFPEGLNPDIPAGDYADDPRALAIAEAARDLNEKREAWLNPPDLVRREPEVVSGYPDRILPVDDAAAKQLKKRTLTNLYNVRPTWLASLHDRLDAAVAEAYHWPAEISEDDALACLLDLNRARTAR